jgi:hypothetical protein
LGFFSRRTSERFTDAAALGGVERGIGRSSARRGGRAISVAVGGRGEDVARVQTLVEDFLWEVLDGEAIAIAHGERVRQDVLELSHVAVERKALERVDVGRFDGVDGAAAARVHLLDELVDQQPDIDRPLAERRQKQRDHPEAVHEVGAEAAAFDLGAQRAVGSRDDADVDRDRFASADGEHRAGLEDAQQLGLELLWNLGHFVQEKSASVGGLHVSGGVADRAGERAADVAEQLALEQRGRQRGAVDGPERSVSTRRACVDGARDELFARPRFATHQDGDVVGGDALDQSEKPLQTRIAAPHAVEKLRHGGLLVEGFVK